MTACEKCEAAVCQVERAELERLRLASEFVTLTATYFNGLRDKRDSVYDAFTFALELAAKDLGYWSATGAVLGIAGGMTKDPS